MIVTSTRDPALRTTFSEAAARNAPEDGGLYLPLLGAGGLGPFADIEELLALPFLPRSTEILARMLAPELERDEVAPMVEAALDFPVVHRELGSGVASVGVLELFHGPTLSFKDFGVRFLAQVLAWQRSRQVASVELAAPAAARIVLTATSGDTGAAVVDAFHRLPGFGVVVLYPAGRISPLQERQIATLGGNVVAFAVDGTFDDCQAMVKNAFADRELASRLALVSANSIHLARLLAQVTYYFEAAARSPRNCPLVVAVPSGNFGNLAAGLIAQRLGAPIACLVAATNANRTVPDFLDGQRFTPRQSVATLSNAMDVGSPNNWQRIESLYAGDATAMRRGLRWGSADDAATRCALAELESLRYRADPHAAVAYEVLVQKLLHGEHGLFLGTAHPAKFEASRNPLDALPPALAEAAARPLLSRPLAADSTMLGIHLLALADRIRS